MKLFSAAGGAHPLLFLAPTLSPTADQVDRVGIAPLYMSAKSALDWVQVPEVSLASKLESE
jgi:hypothetical protein